MIGNKKRWKEDDVLLVSGKQSNLVAKWEDREHDQVSFEFPPNKSFKEMIEEFGQLPIPPYLNRPTENIDLTRYQTQFALLHGSVAAPTAALHFDTEIYQALEKRNIKCNYLTLHVGAGTFKPVSVDNAMDHVMHEEYIIYSKELIESLLVHVGPVIAVGTTSLRSLESLYWFGVGLINGSLSNFHIEQYFPYSAEEKTISVSDALYKVLDWMNSKGLQTVEGTSSIYMVPGYKPKMVSGIITNFHQPQSTLLLLVCALVGNDWKNIYQNALDNNYRFLSYGDSSLLMF
jgi:S-adenosylmethionine:tRNA ribosyltransferase-isomerase